MFILNQIVKSFWMLQSLWEKRFTALCATLGIIVLMLLAFGAQAQSQSRYQKPIEGIKIENVSPAFAKGEGPALYLHRSVSPYVQRGSFDPFLQLAQSDGYQTFYLDEPVTKEILSKVNLFVIANAYTSDYINYSTLDAPSVYSDDEIALIKNWVKEGGRLLVLADHSPFAGGTIKLASEFGFTYMTGNALSKNSLSSLVKVHIDSKISDGSLSTHPITNGSTGRAPVSHFYAFGGQAIILPDGAKNLITIPDHFETMLGFSPSREFYTAPRIDSGGLSQGATLEYGKGKLIIMGETGGFTAQTSPDGVTFGFEEPSADENKEFILAALRWLVDYKPN